MAPPGNETVAQNACGLSGRAHHCFATAVHLVHLPTNELLMYHGEQDQRVWRIGSDPSQIDWRPMLLPVTVPSGGDRVPDLFCSGHVQLADGSVFVASGNFTGRPSGGGLLQTFRFDPFADREDACTYGWQGAPDAAGIYRTACPSLTHDRWYPTLTMLGDGRVLISGGWSKVAAGSQPLSDGPVARTRLLELYDPSVGPCGTITPLDHPQARFPLDDFPIYPLMFLLPNGDVLYAGSEDVSREELRDGRVLATGPAPQDFRWRSKVFASGVSGGSGVMYAPGKVLKTGGPRIELGQAWPDAVADAEVLDLSAVGPSDAAYDQLAPGAFTPVAPMNRPRHFHTLTALPDGRVLATGGNRYGNGDPVGDRQESPNAACTFEGEPIGERPCDQGCPSLCTDYGGYYYAWSTGDDRCSMLPSDLRCSLIERVACNSDAECEAALPGATCEGGRCRRTCTVEGELCGMISPAASCTLGGELDPGTCPYANNACYATRTAEIWDPQSCTWTELGAQELPRMYHSTALLLPDGRVLSTGGGHRGFVADQPYTEFFEPAYAADPGAPRPDYGFGTDPGDMAAGPPRLAYGGTLRVYVTGDVPVERAALMRLGSVTHGFDMGQLRAPVEVTPVPGEPGAYDVHGPTGVPLAGGGPQAQAPPGYYMLFLLSDQGEPSHARYVWVGPEGGAP